MPRGVPITQEELKRRRGVIFQAVMHLFVEKGFTETSMREIAHAAGLGKSTLYDYFSSKDEILLYFVDHEVNILEDLAEKIISLPLSAGERLRRLLEKQMVHQLDSRRLFLRLSQETQRLGTESQMKIQEIRHRYQDRLCSLVEEGIRSGEFRRVNSLLAVRGLLALLSTAIYTTRPVGSPEEMLQEAFDIFFKGLEVQKTL